MLLAKSALPLAEAVERLLPTYAQLLRELQKAGALEVQIHEPVFVTDRGAAAKVRGGRTEVLMRGGTEGQGPYCVFEGEGLPG